ncbi:MAG: hypothetical protein PUF16_05160 [Lachnospiraceae bacterium]|nr:hypothetical protein [Lachnospiraceae bacterium]
MGNLVKDFLLKRKKRILILLYFIVFTVFFYLIEHVWIAGHYHVLDTPLDHAIPFIPAFVLPYYFWFAYHVWALLPLFIDDDPGEYYRTAFALFSGMTVFIIVSIIFPNTQTLRPAHLGKDIFSKMIGAIYSADTPTNIMPSIHVYNALIANTAICRRAKKYHRAWESALSVFCCVMIILATLFIKQHTLYDLLGAAPMYIVFYYLFFKKFRLPGFLKE